jgi:hypothetical protein
MPTTSDQLYAKPQSNICVDTIVLDAGGFCIGGLCTGRLCLRLGNDLIYSTLYYYNYKLKYDDVVNVRRKNVDNPFYSDINCFKITIYGKRKQEENMLLQC